MFGVSLGVSLGIFFLDISQSRCDDALHTCLVSVSEYLWSQFIPDKTQRGQQLSPSAGHMLLSGSCWTKWGQNDQHQTQSETQRLTATGANVRFNISNDIQPGHVITSNQSEARTQPPVDPTLH